MTELLVFEDKTKGNAVKVRLVDTNGRIMLWGECDKDDYEIECDTIGEGREQFSMMVMRMNNEATN